MTRREILRALGPTALLFPWSARALARRRPSRLEQTAEPRLILLMQSNGTTQAHFWPGADYRSDVLAPLLDDPGLREKTTVIKGLYNRAGGAGNGHDHGFTGLWSGYRSVGSFMEPRGNGPSIDQVLKTALTFGEPTPTLNCGVLASFTPPFKGHRKSFSYTGPAKQVPTQTDLYKLYSMFFPQLAAASGTGAGSTEELARVRLRQQRSVLDYVNDDLRKLNARLPPGNERRKLEAHTTALRALETRLAATLDASVTRPPRCTAAGLPALGLDIKAEENVPALMRLMFDFVALVVSCGLVRIVTFPMGHGGEKWYFGWLGINQNSHDDIAHADDGTKAAVTAKLLMINRWYAEQVAHLARALDAVPGETGGTALDDTLLVWGNELATGPHTMEDIPVVLMGRAAGRLARTGYLVDRGPQDYHRLGTSVLNIMGLPAEGLGEEPTCGRLEGLELS